MADDAGELGFVSLFVLRLFHARVTDVTKRLFQVKLNSEMIVTFSEHLDSLMRQHELSKAELARRSQLSHVAIGNYLNGRTPRNPELQRLAAVFGLNPDYLLNPSKYSAPLLAAKAHAESIVGSESEKNAAYNERALLLTTLLQEDVTPYITGARASLKAARKAKGFSPEEMARQMGYPDAGTYINIEEGRSQMGEKMIKKAAKILGLDESDLMSSEHPIDRSPDKGTFGAIPEINLPPGMTAKYVPLLSLAQCGPNMTWTDDGYTGEGVLAIDCKDPKAFAVKLSGDSMSPKYDPGDTAIIYPSFQPRNGDLVLARLNDDYGGDVMIKLYQSSAETVTLSSYNPVYQPTSFPREAFAILYPVIQITKKLR